MSVSSSSFEHFNSELFSAASRQNNGRSIFLSPTSIALAMSMCTVGARNETLRQMLQVLGAADIDGLTKASTRILSALTLSDRERHIQLKLANRLYAEQHYKLRQDYVSVIQNAFQADMKLEDFERCSNEAVRSINSWIEAQTNNLIRDLLAPSDVTPDTRLVLVNCIYFKGAWLNPFEAHLTDRRAVFHEGNGVTTKVPLMRQRERLPYKEIKDLGVQVVHLPYKTTSSDVQFVFTVILPAPNGSLADVEQRLSSDAALMQQVLRSENASLKTVELHLPKFRMEAQFQLNDVLQQLGMLDAFSEHAADFSGIVNKEDTRNNLFISQVIHKAFISVDEEGCEAAAATAAIFVDECCVAHDPKQLVKMRVDRPFLFVVQEQRRNLILFQGKFLSPDH